MGDSTMEESDSTKVSGQLLLFCFVKLLIITHASASKYCKVLIFMKNTKMVC